MSELKAKIAALAGATAMAAGLGLSVAASANAASTTQPAKANSTAKATGYARCPNGYFCIFDYKNGGGKMARIKTGSPDLTRQGMNNRATSVWNRTGRNFYTYDYKYYRGPHAVDLPGSGNLTSYWSNRISSLKVA